VFTFERVCGLTRARARRRFGCGTGPGGTPGAAPHESAVVVVPNAWVSGGAQLSIWCAVVCCMTRARGCRRRGWRSTFSRARQQRRTAPTRPRAQVRRTTRAVRLLVEQCTCCVLQQSCSCVVQRHAVSCACALGLCCVHISQESRRAESIRVAQLRKIPLTVSYAESRPLQALRRGAGRADAGDYAAAEVRMASAASAVSAGM
jgi:hypothetical protein